jgi:hypothetical protein
MVAFGASTGSVADICVHLAVSCKERKEQLENNKHQLLQSCNEEQERHVSREEC